MWSRWGARGRIVALAIAAVATALVLWTVLFLQVSAAGMDNLAGQVATATANQLADALTSATPAAVVRNRTHAQGAQVVQVLDANGAVSAASEPGVAETPLPIRRPATGQVVTAKMASIPGVQPGRYVAASVGAWGKDGRPIVITVAEPVDLHPDTERRLGLVLAGASMVLLTVLVLVVWHSVGAALRPVGKMTAQVGDINAERLATRVDVPPGGDELTDLGDTVNVMLHRLDVSDRTRRAFIADASHELRNPLATVRLSLESLEFGANDEQLPLVQRACREVERMQAVVQDLLTLASADERGLKLQRERVDLDDLVLDELSASRARGVQCVAELEPVQAYADLARVKQVLRNLAANAARHAGSTVRFGLGQDTGMAVVTVDNDGPVVPPEDRERIFERFVRLDDARARETGGTGLGLSIAKTIVGAHGGSVRCLEAPDGWCRFEVRLPAQASGAPSELLAGTKR